MTDRPTQNRFLNFIFLFYKMDSDEIVDFEADENPSASSTSYNHDDEKDVKDDTEDRNSDDHRDDRIGSRRVRIKGRGHSNIDNQGRYDDRGASYETINESDRGPTKCKKINHFYNAFPSSKK